MTPRPPPRPTKKRCACARNPARRWRAGRGRSALLATLSLSLNDRQPSDLAAGRPLPGAGPLGLAFLGSAERRDGVAFLLPFEIVSIHLLVVLVAAAYLARAKRKTTEAKP